MPIWSKSSNNLFVFDQNILDLVILNPTFSAPKLITLYSCDLEHDLPARIRFVSHHMYNSVYGISCEIKLFVELDAHLDFMLFVTHLS